MKDVVGRRGIGIGSAGLPSYNILLEGHSDALENDVVIYVKQAQTPAVSRHVTDPAVREYFLHEGHRTVISQRALQAHADPWLGWTQGWTAPGSWWPRSRRTRWTWTGATSTTRRRSRWWSPTWARATAAMRAAADDTSGESLVPFSTERAIDAAIAADEEALVPLLVDFAHDYGAQPPGPPDLPRPVPQRPDSGPVTFRTHRVPSRTP
ncbi:hypothetical protein SALBM217S_02614 [Streptomyces griseoloalbus]